MVKEMSKPLTKGDLYRCTGILSYIILAGFSYLIFSLASFGQHRIELAFGGSIVFAFGLFCMIVIDILVKKEE